MSNQTKLFNERVLGYLQAHSLREPALLRQLRKETQTLPLAVMQISPEQGQLMQLLVKLTRARTYLEVGVFTGYSSLAVALALPADGRIVACDINKTWTAIARKYWKMGQVDHKIDLRVQEAKKSLRALVEHGKAGTFDLAFIDADKENYEAYYEYCLQLVRPGGLVMIDNTLWSGKVADPTFTDEETRAIRSLNQKLHQDTRIALSMLPIGDGLSLALKL